jgi:hypothetical protein
MVWCCANRNARADPTSDARWGIPIRQDTIGNPPFDGKFVLQSLYFGELQSCQRPASDPQGTTGLDLQIQ